MEDKGEFLASSGLWKFTGGEQMKQCEEIMRRLTAEVSNTVSKGTESTDLCNYARVPKLQPLWGSQELGWPLQRLDNLGLLWICT